MALMATELQHMAPQQFHVRGASEDQRLSKMLLLTIPIPIQVIVITNVIVIVVVVVIIMVMIMIIAIHRHYHPYDCDDHEGHDDRDLLTVIVMVDMSFMIVSIQRLIRVYHEDAMYHCKINIPTIAFILLDFLPPPKKKTHIF